MLLEDGIVIALMSAGFFMVAMYMLAQLRRDTSIVDIAWGLGFVLIGIGLCLQLDGSNPIFRLTQVLVTIWGLRLFTHILFRKAGKPEDWRYQNWRKDWGKTHWWRSFLQVFMLQGFFMVLIASPMIAAWAAEDTSIAAISYVGAAVWFVGFYFEAVGDYQLNRFLRDKKIAAEAKGKKKKGKKKQPEFMTEGLWRLTRHPNYFGEVTQWWGLWLVVLPTTYGLQAVISPLLITFLLLKVSGIPMLEKKWENNKEFKKYKKKTNAFFPAPPKKK